MYDSEDMKDFSESYTKTNILIWYQFWNIGGASVFMKYVYDFEKRSGFRNHTQNWKKILNVSTKFDL